LKAWRKSIGLQQDEAAVRLGLSPSTYQNYERETRRPDTDGWEAFARGGINTNWLLTGEGEMLLSDVLYGTHQATVLGGQPEDGKYVALPLYNNIHAAAGHGAVIDHERPDDALMFQAAWIRSELGARPDDLCLIRVSGDSMEPTLRAGDVILVNRQACKPDREGIYILRVGEMLLVKRLQALPGGQVKVTSDNAAFDAWTINLADQGADVIIVGRVVWSGRRL
jgi:phage repressor protein C with HTH and peptisase S24 domain